MIARCRRSTDHAASAVRPGWTVSARVSIWCSTAVSTCDSAAAPDGVEVAGGGRRQAPERVACLPLRGGGRHLRVVARQGARQDVDRGVRMGRLEHQDAVRSGLSR
jgi:hypothetical protein